MVHIKGLKIRKSFLESELPKNKWRFIRSDKMAYKTYHMQKKLYLVEIILKPIGNTQNSEYYRVDEIKYLTNVPGKSGLRRLAREPSALRGNINKDFRETLKNGNKG